MRRIHAAHHTICRVLLDKKFPKVFCQVWSLLFSIMPPKCVAAGCSNTTKDGVSLHRFPSDSKYRRIWTTKVKLARAKWLGPTEHSFLCSAHFKQTCFERGLHSQFGMAYKAMLLPYAIPTIFPLSKKAVKAPTKKRGAFLKRERLRLLLPCITQSTSVQNDMFTPCSPFQCSRHENMPWFSTLIKHRVWFYILARQT